MIHVTQWWLAFVFNATSSDNNAPSLALCYRSGWLHIRDAAPNNRGAQLSGLSLHERHVAALSLHIQPSSGMVPMSAEVLPQPGQHRQRLQLQVWHKELQQGLPFHLLCSSKTAVSMERRDLAFFFLFSGWSRKEKYTFSQNQCLSTHAIQSKHSNTGPQFMWW